MDIESLQSSLLGMKPSFSKTEAKEWSWLVTRKQYRNEKNANSDVGTPILQPIKAKVDIPPLDGFPKSAIPMKSDLLFNLSGDSK